MTDFFAAQLAVSVSAGILILAVILLRWLLRRGPRWLLCLLWVPVALRLLLPIPLRSGLSLIPAAVSRDTVVLWTEARLGNGPRQEIPIPGLDEVPATEADPPAEPAGTGPAIAVPETVKPGRTPMEVLSCIWLGGAGIMLLYAALSYLRLRRQTAVSAPVEKGVRICDGLRSPFILGLLRPRIYLPSDLSAEDAGRVLAHERAHLRRRDHIWKPLGYLILSLWWFHPLVWAAYVLFCRDIELACDEAVVSALDPAEKRAYAETLLLCAMPRHGAAACPLAFGETGVKARVKAILNYKKPAFWVILAVVAALIVLLVCFLTEPKSVQSGETANDGTETASEELSMDAAARAEHLGVALQRLADDFDAAGQTPDYEHLTAFLRERADFAALNAGPEDMVELLRRGFTPGSTRERILVHYAIARSAMELDPDSFPDLRTGLDSVEPLNEAQYNGLLGAVAGHVEPLFTEMTGQPQDRIEAADALHILYALYPGFPAEPGSVTYSAVRADGEKLELTCITEVGERLSQGDTVVTFRLGDTRRRGSWSYELAGDSVRLVNSETGTSYSEMLEEIYRGHLVTLDADRAPFEEAAAELADFPFDPAPVACLGLSRDMTLEALDMTEETWEYLTLENGEAGVRPNRRAPETVDGTDWTLYLRFAQELDVVPYLWSAWYEKPLESRVAAEQIEEVGKVYDRLLAELGDPDLPYGKQHFSYEPIESRLTEGFVTNKTYGALWILSDGIDVPGWHEAVVLCMYTVEPTPEGQVQKLQFRLTSSTNTQLARYQQFSFSSDTHFALDELVDALTEDMLETEEEVYADFSEPYRNQFGMGIHDFALFYRRSGYLGATGCYESYPFEKADAMTVDGRRYDVRFWADGRYGAFMDPPLCHVDYTPAAGETMTTADIADLAEALTAQYGAPLTPRHTRKGTVAAGLAGAGDGFYESFWLISEDPDYPALPEDYYPERFRPWSRNVEVASISLEIREGVPACTLSFAVRPLRALPVDWESMAPGA